MKNIHYDQERDVFHIHDLNFCEVYKTYPEAYSRLSELLTMPQMMDTKLPMPHGNWEKVKYKKLEGCPLKSFSQLWEEKKALEAQQKIDKEIAKDRHYKHCMLGLAIIGLIIIMGGI